MKIMEMSTKTLDALPGINTLIDEASEVSLSMVNQFCKVSVIII
jgi:hypothetical protein